jgi:tryptophanyl-tRNA synthetase
VRELLQLFLVGGTTLQPAYRGDHGQDEIRQGCASATLGCVECKGILLKSLERFLAPMQERRAQLDANPGRVWEVLAAGDERARAEARKTMDGVRELIGF